MLARGNGNPGRCAFNLLMMTRGEIPYERLKGLDAGLADLPAPEAAQRLREDAGWLLKTYEPRVMLEGVDFESLIPDGPSADGNYNVNAHILLKGGDAV